MKNDMTIDDLAALVQEMRIAQKAYFRTRSNLRECMALERKVDAAVADILNPKQERRDIPGQQVFDFGGAE